jgi:hypothetical protein
MEQDRRAWPGISAVCHLYRPIVRQGAHEEGAGAPGAALPPLAAGRPLPARHPGRLLAPPRRGRPAAGRAALPGVLRRGGAGALERAGARAVAPDHHRRSACLGSAGRCSGGGAAAAGPGQLREGGRVPAARRDPLPRRHPPGRRHRLPLCWLLGPTTRAVHRHPPRGGAPAGGPGGPGALPGR